MLARHLIAGALVLSAQVSADAADRDYLQRGEEKLTAEYQIKYDRAIRRVLARGWAKDVVLRMVNLPPFQPESVAGIARTPTGYQAFSVTVSKQIWETLGLGSPDPKRNRIDYRSIRPILHQRMLSDSLAARVAAVLRHVLADARNYGKDTAIYLDTDHFSYFLSFSPHERLKAYTTGWGLHTEQLIYLAAAVASHANGAPDGYLVKEVAKAERKLGI